MLFKLTKVSKGYGNLTVLRDINLAIEEGEFVAIVGPSSSGKTTLLSLMAGLLRPDAGTITLRGRPLTGPRPDVGVVFQNYSLLPWRTVYGNLSLAVDHVFARWPKPKRRAHILQYLEMVHLEAAADKWPHELSAGMKQRVALARALATRPQVLLLDQPFGAVDLLTRQDLHGQLLRLCNQFHLTVVLVANDIDEALLLADRILPTPQNFGGAMGASIEVSIPHPRDAQVLRQTPEYRGLRLRAMGLFAGGATYGTTPTSNAPPSIKLQPAGAHNTDTIYRPFGTAPR